MIPKSSNASPRSRIVSSRSNNTDYSSVIEWIATPPFPAYPFRGMKKLIVLLLLCVSAFAQKFTIDQVMSSPFPNQLVAAKKAARVVWVLNDHGASNLWIAEGPDWRGEQPPH